MADNFQTTTEALLKGMEEFVTSKTVVGEPITVRDTVILPLIDVSFGMAASAKAEEKKRNGGGGIGGKMTPSALLVIKDGSVRLINIKNMDGVSKLLDMVPDLISKIKGDRSGDNQAARAAWEANDDIEKEF